jgi:pteridine reductase
MSPPNHSQHPVALITGSSKRIGAVIARQLHLAGYNLILHYRDSKTDAELLMQEFNQARNNSAVALVADLDKPDEIERLSNLSVKAFGRLDLLINNASMFYPTPIQQAKQTDWDKLFNSNLRGPYFLIQSLVELLKQSSGCIINIADIYADHPLMNHSIYCMAKASNQMMTKALALELAPHIRVNGIAPGAIIWPENPSVDTNKLLEKIPMKQKGDPVDIAKLVLYLARDAQYITGQIIKVDGGRSLQI